MQTSACALGARAGGPGARRRRPASSTDGHGATGSVRTARWRHSAGSVPHQREPHPDHARRHLRHRVRHPFAPANERSASSTGALLASDGTLFVTFRLGTERESGDGHAAVMARTDLGETWELRHLGLDRGVARRGPRRDPLIPPGRARARRADGVGPLDRPLRPDEAVGQPGDAGPAADAQLPHDVAATAGGTWSEPRPIDLPHPSSSTTGPLIRLPNGDLAQPFEHWKAYDDPAVGRPACAAALLSRRRRDLDRRSRRGRGPRNRLYFWDQRLAAHPGTRQLVAMFWTFDRVAEPRSADPHRLGLARRPDVDRADSRRRSTASTASRSRSGTTCSPPPTPTGATRPGSASR